MMRQKLRFGSRGTERREKADMRVKSKCGEGWQSERQRQSKKEGPAG
jgi:hypothetical protein